MKTIYPSKKFLEDAKAMLDAREILEISVAHGWRTRKLAEDVKFWPPTAALARDGGGKYRSPSILLNILNLRLVTLHWFAISAQYEMRSKVEDTNIVLTYLPI